MPDRVIRKLDGPRGGGLFALGFIGIAHGFAYLPMTGARDEILPTGLQIIGDLIPVTGYGGAWLAIGGLALWSAFTDHDGLRRIHQRWGFSGMVGMCLAWGFAYALGWALTVVNGWSWIHRAFEIHLFGVSFEGWFPWFAIDGMDRQWIAAAYYLGLTVVTVALSRCRNPFVIDLRGG